MAITATEVPTNIKLSRNIIRLQLLSNSYYISGGTTRQILFAINANPTNGDTLQIEWTHNGIDYDITLTWATTPDGSPDQIALLTGGTMVNYLTNVVKLAIDMHPVLSDFWEVTNISTGGFYLSAKVYGIAPIAVAVSGSFLLDGTIGPITYPSISVELPLLLRDDLFFLVRFFVEEEWDSGIYTQVAEAPYKPSPNENNEGVIDVDIQHFFEPSVRKHTVDTSEDVMAAIQLIRAMNKRCRIEVWEYYDNAKQGKGYRSASFRVINGGLDAAEFDQNTPIHPNWGAALKYLTYRPNVREVTKNQSHHLYWLCWRNRGLLPSTDPEAYRLKAKVYYTDGTNSTTTIASDTTEIKQLDTVKLRAGFDANNLGALQPSKTPYKYEVWFEAQIDTTPLGGVITYRLKPNHYRERYVTWRNSFGCAECTRFFGESKFLVEIERAFAEVPPPMADTYGLTEDFFTAIAHNQSMVRTITIESGPMSADELFAHSDMLRSDIVFMHLGVENATPRMMPMKLKPGSFEMGYRDVEGNYINGVKVTLEFMDDRNWSNTMATW